MNNSQNEALTLRMQRLERGIRFLIKHQLLIGPDERNGDKIVNRIMTGGFAEEEEKEDG